MQEVIRSFTGIAPTLVSGRGLFQSIIGLLPFKRPLYIVGRYYNSYNFFLHIYNL